MNRPAFLLSLLLAATGVLSQHAAQGQVSESVPRLGDTLKQCTAKYGHPVENLDWMAAAPATRARAYKVDRQIILIEFTNDRACVIAEGNDSGIPTLAQSPNLLLAGNSSGEEWSQKKGPKEFAWTTTIYRRRDGKALAVHNTMTSSTAFILTDADWAKNAAVASNAGMICMGDSAEQCAAKFGKPVSDANEKAASLIPGTIGKVYQRGDFKFLVYFTSGKACMMMARKPNRINSAEMNALFVAESRGAAWYGAIGEMFALWQRSDKKLMAVADDEKALSFFATSIISAPIIGKPEVHVRH